MVHGNTKHGYNRRNGKRHYLYTVWANIKARCCDPNCESYNDYGGRGITLHPDWHNSQSFIDYVLTNLGPKPDNHTLDRINNNEGYRPGNLKWSNRVEQNSNRRNNIHVTHEGVTLLLSEWAVKTGIPYSTLKDRYRLQGLRGHELLTKRK